MKLKSYRKLIVLLLYIILRFFNTSTQERSSAEHQCPETAHTQNPFLMIPHSRFYLQKFFYCTLFFAYRTIFKNQNNTKFIIDEQRSRNFEKKLCGKRSWYKRPLHFAYAFFRTSAAFFEKYGSILRST